MLDPIRTSNTLTHVPRLRHFLDAIPRNESVAPSIQSSELAVQVLGTLSAALNPHGLLCKLLTRALRIGGRQHKLRSQVVKHMNDAIFLPVDKTKHIRKAISKKVKERVRESRRRSGRRISLRNVICQNLRTLTGSSVHEIIDIARIDGRSIYLSPTDFEQRRAMFEKLQANIRADETHARAMRAEMINSTHYI